MRRFSRRIRYDSNSPYEKLHDAIATQAGCNLYAELTSLEDPSSEAVASDVIAWYGAQGWLGELEKAVRRRMFENAREWSSSDLPATKEDDGTEDPPLDSNSDPYRAEDSDWWPQGGRDVSITFGKEGEIAWNIEKLDQVIEQIESVIGA